MVELAESWLWFSSEPLASASGSQEVRLESSELRRAARPLGPAPLIRLTWPVFPSAGRFRSHFASQSPGMPGAAAHPHPVSVHGCTRALYHTVPGLLPEHP